MKPIDFKLQPKLIQEQRLVLTQELQLFLRLIQMTTLELREYLEEQMIENPVLEEEAERTKETGEESSPSSEDVSRIDSNEVDIETGIANILHDSYWSPFRDSYEPREEDPWESRLSTKETLLDHLKWQLELSDFSLKEKKIASLIIGNTNEDGYLDVDIKDIAALVVVKDECETSSGNASEARTKVERRAKDKIGKDGEKAAPPEEAQKGAEGNSESDIDALEEDNLEFYRKIVESDEGYAAEVERVLKKVQYSFDPIGICARNLTECLLIQAKEFGYSGTFVEKIIDRYLEALGEKKYQEIAHALGITTEEVQQAASLISSLEPKPGRPFYARDTEKYIVPDFYIYKVGEEFQIQLNRDIPRIRVSGYYRSLLQGRERLAPEVKKYIKEKIEAAGRIIKCLQEREEMVKKVITKIVEHQGEFLEKGLKYIKPLRLRDVAEAVGVHESTVSRVTSRRYAYTPRGTIELRSFFSRGIKTSQGGDELSFELVKALVEEIIAGEPPHNPYSDEDVSNILRHRNIKLARRTIAKYRKILNIPSSVERKAKEEKEKEG